MQDKGAPEKPQTFWGEEEQRNERAFVACGETSDMKFVTTTPREKYAHMWHQVHLRLPPLTLSPRKPADLLRKEYIEPYYNERGETQKT
jgi:hypothetical protein